MSRPRRERPLPPRASGARWILVLAVLAAAAFCCGPATLIAQEVVEPAPATDDEERADLRDADEDNGAKSLRPAALVRIKLPLASGDDEGVRLALTRARDRLLADVREKKDPRRPILVIEFVTAAPPPAAGAPDEQPAAPATPASQFETVLSLARLLNGRELTDVQTVAWLPNSVRGHGVLAALAADAIVMDADATLGNAAADEPNEGAISPTVIAAYREVAEAKRTVPVPIAESMIDPQVEVIEVESDEGVRLLKKDDVAAFRRDHEILSEEPLSAAGAAGEWTGREGRQLGFVKYLAGDRGALAAALDVSPQSLVENQALAVEWKPAVIDLRGKITPGMADEISTLLGEQLTQGVNWIVLRIDSEGGDLPASMKLAGTLADLDASEVRVLAYVPAVARGGAAIVALSADELVMHPQAKLGAGPDAVDAPPEPPGNNRRLPPPGPQPPWQRPPRGAGVDPDEVRDRVVERAAAVASLRDSLAQRTDRSWSLLASMIDPQVKLAMYRHKTTGQQRLMSAAEVADRPDAADWIAGAAIFAGAGALEFTGATAAQLGVAQPSVENFDQLKQRFAIRGEVPVIEPSWALRLVQALRSTSMATFLLLLGFVGVYIELKTPGVGIGAVVSVTAFSLFFWSRYLDQTATSLEIVMFVAGFALLCLEVFVIPGFGVFGLTGAGLIVISLVLAMQTFVLPHTEAQRIEMLRSLTTMMAAAVGVIAAAFALRRVLPHAPILNRMILAPPPAEERITLSHREAVADYAHLTGRVGEAVTDLLPAGKALIDDELVDVIAEGVPLDRGTKIEVVAAHANRVVVRAAKG